MLKTASATIALLALANPALAAACATPGEATALRTAVIQQELMVAALQCQEAPAYNRFVTTYRGELQTSDAILKSFFIRRGGEHGEAGYDTFKTKAANLSALEQARNTAAFCADAHGLFKAAMNHRGSLMSFVDAHAASTDIGGICADSRPIMAKADEPLAAPTVKVSATPAPDIGGVPAHSLPAMPYRRAEGAARARALANAAPDDEADDVALSYAEEEAPPPPRPRYYDIGQRGYYPDRGYAPRAYGPPPGWQQGWQREWRDYPPPPRPRYGWYSPY